MPLGNNGGPGDSWIVTDRVTGKAVLETYNRKVIDAINQTRYRVEPALEYLCRVNREIRNANTER